LPRWPTPAPSCRRKFHPTLDSVRVDGRTGAQFRRLGTLQHLHMPGQFNAFNLPYHLDRPLPACLPDCQALAAARAGSFDRFLHLMRPLPLNFLRRSNDASITINLTLCIFHISVQQKLPGDDPPVPRHGLLVIHHHRTNGATLHSPSPRLNETLATRCTRSCVQRSVCSRLQGIHTISWSAGGARADLDLSPRAVACCRRLLACCRRSWSAWRNAGRDLAPGLLELVPGLAECPDTPGGINLPCCSAPQICWSLDLRATAARYGLFWSR